MSTVGLRIHINLPTTVMALIVGAVLSPALAHSQESVALTAAERAACARLPLITRRFVDGSTHADVHRDPVTRQTCVVLPQPSTAAVAFQLDGVLYCPVADSASGPPRPPLDTISPGRIHSIDVSKDSTMLSTLGCALRPEALITVRLKPK